MKILLVQKKDWEHQALVASFFLANQANGKRAEVLVVQLPICANGEHIEQDRTANAKPCAAGPLQEDGAFYLIGTWIVAVAVDFGHLQHRDMAFKLLAQAKPFCV